MQHLTPPALAERLADTSRPAPVLLDVREPWEVQTVVIANSVTIPMRELPARIEEFQTDDEIVCICHHGGRSAQVAMFLESRGFKQIYNLSGGIDGWAKQVDPSLPSY